MIMGKKLNDFKMWVLGSAKLFWRVLWTVVTLCWIVIAACLVETCNRRDREDKRNSHYTMRISPNMEFYPQYSHSRGDDR
jgi:dolichyl-phosphate-mannose--protein O-mannosyl transferase